MVNNPGFLVQYDRFSLNDEAEYILQGYLAPGASVRAELDGKEHPAEVRMLTDNTDERYGGAETRVTVHFAEEDFSAKRFRLLTESDRGRRLAFEISMKELREKRGAIRYFIDDYTVDAKEELFRVTGWAVSRHPVEVRAYTADGKKIEGAVERYRRLDTAELFEEYPVEEKNGFHVELHGLPDGPVRIRLTAEGAETVLTYPADPAGYRAKRAGRLLKKAGDALRYNGPRALAVKTWNKLFNPAMREVRYSDWIGRHLPSERVLSAQRREELPLHPLISIVVPCYRTPETYLKELADSVKKQTYPHFELILSDGSGAGSPIGDLLSELASSDDRIRAVRNEAELRISDNTNAALKEARGEWIAFADHDDVLVASALFECMKYLNAHPETEIIYTDEDKLNVGGHFIQPNMKPDFDPDLLRSVNYICHLLLVKKSLLDAVRLPDGRWLDPAFDGAQDHDLLLRLTEKTENIGHVPKVLYHWRFFEGSTAANPESKTWAFEAGRRAVEAHYRRLHFPAEIRQGEFPGLYRTIWHWEETPKVSVIIPNKDHLADLRKCLSSLDRCTAWPDLEILIIENNSTEEETFAGYRELEEADDRIRVLRYEGGFNYSAINNFGVREARGEYLLLLNNDTEFITDAVTEMMGFAMRPDVGAVGARLYYGDDTIQHAGAVIGWGGVAGHAFVNQKRGESGYQHRIICQQDMSAVTAACMLVPKSVFEEAGGFTEELAVAFNDIDLCMKIRSAGYLIVYNPFAELYHYESKSRGLENTPEKKSRFGKELKYFQKKWPDILRDGDPYYSPNLSMITQDFSLKRI
ncbi:MAG: glycosyltransferase family 2 protein [Lachnospiraceae bacterium]|nr:glycosyltransferase family 2 protein [Lachnospiraceae bacterium]